MKEYSDTGLLRDGNNESKSVHEGTILHSFDEVSESLQRFHFDGNVIGHDKVSQTGMWDLSLLQGLSHSG